MSAIALIYGADVVEPNVAVEEEPKEAKRWPIAQSMYIRVLKDAISTILAHESFLLCDNEIKYLRSLDEMDVNALYLLIRLSLRKPGWHRQKSYYRYEHLMEKGKLEEACKTLCNRSLTEPTERRAPELNRVKSDSSSGSRDAPIDLTSDDSDEDVGVNGTDHPSSDEPTFDLSYHALSQDNAELCDLLGTLSGEELKALAQQNRIATGSKKTKDLVAELLRISQTQSTLSFFKSSDQTEKGSDFKTPQKKVNSRLRHLCMSKIGQCMKINGDVVSLMRRLNLIFFRGTTYEEQMFVPSILVACKKRKYSWYEAKRTTTIFPSRSSLLQYEAALNLEREIEQLVSEYHMLGKKDVEEKMAMEQRLVEYHKLVTEKLRISLTLPRNPTGLQRFEAGYVYVRILHHTTTLMGKIQGKEKEIAILERLLHQDRYLLGKRGSWYDRLAYLYDEKSNKSKNRVYELVKKALLDEETRLRYRPKLLRRLARLENSLDIPTQERHFSDAELKESRDVYVVGVRLDTSSEPTTLGSFFSNVPAALSRRASGKTSWKGNNGLAISVEDFALEHYAKEGFKGKHCEGRIIRFVFGLLFHDILFHPIPGAFETQYQTAPLDLIFDTFYISRKSMIEKRLQEILDGQALKIATKVDENLRENKIFVVGLRWDTFSKEEILEIIDCLPPKVIHEICLQQVQDYEASGGGVPDLIVWNPETKNIRFVEVKSPSDKLSETQKLWIHFLTKAGADVEVCHVETSKDQQERLKKSNSKRGRKSSGTGDGEKTSTKRRRSSTSASTTNSSRRTSFSTISGNSSSASSIHIIEVTEPQMDDSEEELEVESVRFASEEIFPIQSGELDGAQSLMDGTRLQRSIAAHEKSYIRKRGDGSDSEMEGILEDFRSALKKAKRE
ncbi:hypothetical protein CPB86DRAFT_782042 [Serendipita vermifera]|nr:hypothetical protein CPB86DRAFT_782042 [Serendipita vermifera]